MTDSGCATRLKGQESNDQLVERYFAALTAMLQGYETILSKQDYLAGNVRYENFHLVLVAHVVQEITLADLFHLPYGRLVGKAGFDILESGQYPNVSRYASVVLYLYTSS